MFVGKSYIRKPLALSARRSPWAKTGVSNGCGFKNPKTAMLLTATILCSSPLSAINPVILPFLGWFAMDVSRCVICTYFTSKVTAFATNKMCSKFLQPIQGEFLSKIDNRLSNDIEQNKDILIKASCLQTVYRIFHENGIERHIKKIDEINHDTLRVNEAAGNRCCSAIDCKIKALKSLKENMPHEYEVEFSLIIQSLGSLRSFTYDITKEQNNDLCVINNMERLIEPNQIKRHIILEVLAALDSAYNDDDLESSHEYDDDNNYIYTLENTANDINNVGVGIGFFTGGGLAYCGSRFMQLTPVTSSISQHYNQWYYNIFTKMHDGIMVAGKTFNLAFPYNIGNWGRPGTWRYFGLNRGLTTFVKKTIFMPTINIKWSGNIIGPAVATSLSGLVVSAFMNAAFTSSK